VFRLISLLPLWVLQAAFGLLARAVRLFGWRRALVDGALERCLAERTPAERAAISAGFYRYLGQVFAEVVHGDRFGQPELEARLRIENPEAVQAVLDRGRRVMILAAHHCNWEWLLLRCSSAFSEPLVAAYKPASREWGDRPLRRMRTRFGATLVPSKQIVQHLIERRGAVKLLALVADQSPPASSEQQTWLKFFGQDTAFFNGPGWIASKLGYEVFFAAMRPESPGYYSVRFLRLTEAGARAETDAVIRAYAAAVEQHVRLYPAQYFWAYNRWKRGKRLYDRAG